jgi:hypothetical protein
VIATDRAAKVDVHIRLEKSTWQDVATEANEAGERTFSGMLVTLVKEALEARHLKRFPVNADDQGMF